MKVCLSLLQLPSSDICPGTHSYREEKNYISTRSLSLSLSLSLSFSLSPLLAQIFFDCIIETEGTKMHKSKWHRCFHHRYLKQLQRALTE